MSDAGQREWRFYLAGMIGFAGKAIAYTDGLDQAGFAADGIRSRMEIQVSGKFG